MLDAPQQRHSNRFSDSKETKVNLFDGNYRQFKLTSSEQCTENVRLFRFQIVIGEIDTEKCMINAPPTFHIFIGKHTIKIGKRTILVDNIHRSLAIALNVRSTFW